MVQNRNGGGGTVINGFIDLQDTACTVTGGIQTGKSRFHFFIDFNAVIFYLCADLSG